MSRNGGRRLVLIADDDPELRILFSEVLSEEGFQVVTAANGEQALELAERIRPDVLALDLMMPVMDGFGVLSRLDRLGEKRPRVIAMSAFAEYAATARRLGADATIEKPFALDSFIELVHAVAEGRPAPEVPRANLGHDEERRLRAIVDLQLNHPAEGELEEFARQVAAIFEVPAALVSIVTRDRQYWHAMCGITGELAEARGTPREQSFCAHAVVARAALVVQDTHENPFFRNNPLVLHQGLRFYAGVPIAGRSSEPLGTLCVLDFVPHRFTWFDLELLSILARRVAADLDRRERARTPADPRCTFPSLEEVDHELGLLGRGLFEDVLRAQACRQAESRRPLSVAVIVQTESDIGHTARGVERRFNDALVGRLGAGRLGVVRMSGPDALRLGLVEAAGPEAQVAVAAVHGGPELAAQVLRQLEESFGRAGFGEALPAS